MQQSKKELLLAIKNLIEFFSKLDRESDAPILSKYYDLCNKAEQEALIDLSDQILDLLQPGHASYFGSALYSDDWQYLEKKQMNMLG